MMVLVIAGAALVGFGALVLLIFPERPGGKVAWHGFEVNSVGAGLPLIALGVVAIAIAGPIQFPGAMPGSPPAAPVIESGSAAATGERTVTLEDGTRNRDIVRVDQPKDQPIRITFTQNSRPLGALTLLPFPKDGLFKVQDVVDARNQPVEEYSNSIRGGPKNVLQNWDVLHIRFEDRLYRLRVGGFDAILVNFEQVAE
jgi:hypothetical protein